MTVVPKQTIAPMEALPVRAIPAGPDLQYEPKWDGFRCIIFRDRDEIEIQSKAGKSLARYFPEIVSAVRALPPARFVLDGELVIPRPEGLSFDALLARIHPANSRVMRLAAATPALVIIFDLLGTPQGESMVDRPLRQRRRELESFARCFFRSGGAFRLSPATTRLDEARRWLSQVGSTLDGIMVKHLDLPYRSGDRSGMQKIKNYRSADCVVGGFRFNEGRDVVGSLLLGLFDEQGRLDHVGFTSTIRAADKRMLTAKLKPLIGPPGFTGNKPGGPSRWSSERSAAWIPLRPALVVEVCYDHFSGGRFRHGTQILRWRPDKEPRQCTFEQVRQTSADLTKLLGA